MGTLSQVLKLIKRKTCMPLVVSAITREGRTLKSFKKLRIDMRLEDARRKRHVISLALSSLRKTRF